MGILGATTVQVRLSPTLTIEGLRLGDGTYAVTLTQIEELLGSVDDTSFRFATYVTLDQFIEVIRRQVVRGNEVALELLALHTNNSFYLLFRAQ